MLNNFKEKIHINELVTMVRNNLVFKHGKLILSEGRDITELIKQEVAEMFNAFKVPNYTLEEAQKYVISRMIGMGPIDKLLYEDPEISEIMINGPNKVFIEKNGQIMLSDIKFESNQEVLNILDKIVRKSGRKVNFSEPTVDARFGEMRVNAVIPPAADMPYITIRRFVKKAFTTDELIKTKYMTKEIAEFLKWAVKGRLNIIVAGATGCGKTTFMRWLCQHIPENERIITLEDTSELNLERSHLIKLETCEKADAYRLMINCLRMRPDRIIMGEIRGAEAIQLLEAMGTGHEGSISSVHTNYGKMAAIQRIIRAAAKAGTVSPEEIKAMISEILNLIVFLKRFPDGSRKIIGISQVYSKDGEPAFRDIYKYDIYRRHYFNMPLSNDVLEIMVSNTMTELPKIPPFMPKEKIKEVV
ncbi:CpaF family protein [Desulfofalx alkaliphila]|uniref:CpaF family protein n=1 Tax=Desulfofalx alkaliphila TaxID=105483 RepID=UPI0006904616|nr:ATPase, T2SS/T4P/T4SS family [Desulfofalx alkaliphila]